ncbi:MAG: hypothetical protein IJS71_04970 [Clostridia bacterium]|nr:hypothetical protein [Clostridia bacterium]MBQ7445275.1 hypothetical protein [Clostridia bacterium]MCR5694935.1 hypothetical protein [Clostridia bacterium]
MPDITYEIVETLAVFTDSDTRGGWAKELNLISWNGNPAKYDIRSWNEDHSRMGKGITLSEDEMKQLKKALDGIF